MEKKIETTGKSKKIPPPYFFKIRLQFTSPEYLPILSQAANVTGLACK